MAKTIAKARGYDAAGQTKEARRLGTMAAEGRADTWRTFTACRVKADGSGSVEVKRDGALLHKWEFGPEDQEADGDGDEEHQPRGHVRFPSPFSRVCTLRRLGPGAERGHPS